MLRLKRLRKGPESNPQASSSNEMSDESKIRKQLFLDVEQFGKEVRWFFYLFNVNLVPKVSSLLSQPRYFAVHLACTLPQRLSKGKVSFLSCGVDATCRLILHSAS